MAELVQLRKDMQDIILLQSKVEVKQESKQKNMQTVKLPKLELLSFNGDKTKWYEFWGFWVASTDATHIFVWIWGSNMAAFPVMVPDFFIL